VISATALRNTLAALAGLGLFAAATLARLHGEPAQHCPLPPAGGALFQCRGEP
jgi:hypothetical protein